MKTIPKLPPMAPRKPDTTINPAHASDTLQSAKQRDSGKVPLRIDNKTIILVDTCKCNTLYARKVKSKFNSEFNINR